MYIHVFVYLTNIIRDFSIIISNCKFNNIADTLNSGSECISIVRIKREA